MDNNQTLQSDQRSAAVLSAAARRVVAASRLPRPLAWCWLIAAGALIAATCCSAAEVRTLQIGDQAPDFKLPGVDGKQHALADFDQAEVLVIIFTCNHCPTAQAYEERIKKLHADYQQRNVAVVAISPNSAEAVRLDELGYTDVGDSLEDMKYRAKMQDFQFPYLYDGDAQEVARAYGPVATPHVFVFDRQRKLRYVGRIDNSDVKQVTSHDTRNAIDALLAGEPVPVEKTKVFGCSVKWADKIESARKSIEKWNQEEVSLTTIGTPGVRELVQNDSEKYRLINVWATWCGPCVTELPELVTMNRMYRRRPFELITISADGPEKKDEALKLLKQMHVSSTNYLFDSDERYELIEALDDQWPGALPHTLLIAPGGKVVYRQNGPIDAQKLKTVIADTLGRTY
jgi:peroxiredoxin